jgi:hypothetical protein
MLGYMDAKSRMTTGDMYSFGAFGGDVCLQHARVSDSQHRTAHRSITQRHQT